MSKVTEDPYPEEDNVFEDSDGEIFKYSSWSKEGRDFRPSGKTVSRVDPGFYTIDDDAHGYYLANIKIRSEDLIVLPDEKVEEVLKEIESFWGKEEKFKEFGIPFKRGIFLHGPPGTGKSSIVRLIIDSIIKNGGICIGVRHPDDFISGIRLIREIEPDLRVVVLMEDLDKMWEKYNQKELLNILDGVEVIEKCVFLATANHKELLPATITNRPSRFDSCFEIGNPSEKVRKFFLEKVILEKYHDKVNFTQWAADTDNLSLAHLKELVISVLILGNDYEITLNKLRSMSIIENDE